MASPNKRVAPDPASPEAQIRVVLAGLAMQKLIESRDFGYLPDMVAQYAVAYADALLKELE